MNTFNMTLYAALVAGLVAAPEARAADTNLVNPTPKATTAFTQVLTMLGVDAEEAERYWRMYGFIADGSMMRPDAFENYGQPVETTVEMEVEAEVDAPILEPPAPSPLMDGQSTAIFIEPSLLDACGMPQPTAYFEFDSAKVSEGFDPMMRILADCMSDYPLDDARLTITGHTDPRGPEEYNRELGLERANAVARELGAFGLDLERVDTYSWGEAKASSDPDDWADARRVVIRLDR